MSGPTFVNWRAVGAVVLAARADDQLSNADYRLAVEVAARIDPDTGTARVSVRDLAAAVHNADHRSTGRRLHELERRGYLKSEGTGRAGHASEANMETYMLGGAVAAPHARSRGAVAAPGRGAVAAPEKKDRDGSPPSGGTVSHPGAAAALAPSGAAAEPGQEDQAGNGEPAPIPAEVWEILTGGQPRPRRSTADERAAEEEVKHARARRLVAEGDWQSGPSLSERSSA
jgi:hypothetical protein